MNYTVAHFVRTTLRISVILIILGTLHSEEVDLPKWKITEGTRADGGPEKLYKASITIQGVVFNSEVSRSYIDSGYQWQQRVTYFD